MQSLESGFFHLLICKIMNLRFIHVAVNQFIPFCAEQYSIVRRAIIYLSSINGCLGDFLFGANTNKSAVNIHSQALCLDIIFHFTWVNTQEEDCWVIWYVYLFKKLLNCFPKCLDHCAFSDYLRIAVVLCPRWSALGMVSLWFYLFVLSFSATAVWCFSYYIRVLTTPKFKQYLYFHA